LVIACANAGPAASRAAHSAASLWQSSTVSTTRLTRPMRSASARQDQVAEEQQLAAWPSPTIRGSR
jgi:hypothetical protein